jgi:hypothetical protein
MTPGMDAASLEPETSTDGKSCTPQTTVKKLPWLDGRNSRTVSTTPTKRLVTNASSPSPPERLLSHQSPVAKGKRVAGRRLTITVNPQVSGSSPSPVARHRQSQARRAPNTHNDSLPADNQASYRRNRLHEQQEVAIAHHHRASEQDGSGDVRPRADHPESSDSMFPTDVISSTSPEVVSRAQMTPSQPAPIRRGLERVGNRRLSNAIEGLEDMVQEAIEIADETTDQLHVEEIYEIIEDARVALQDASAEPAKHLMATTSPLVLSESPKEIGNISLVIPEAHDDVHRGSVAFDWAYSQQHRRSDSKSSSSSSSDIEERRHVNFGTQSDLLLPPQPTQTAPRDHVDFVLRPAARDESRGRSRQRLNGDSAVPTRRHRHRHDSRHVPNKSRSRRRQYMSSTSSLSGSSLDEEEIRVNPYGNTLTVREQARNHTFNLHRQHRRQPIARNWSKSKKRLAAIIACINTALLGIIVGIYVGQQITRVAAPTDRAQAGEVPRIQYTLADEKHQVVVGNAV